jgi:hypothetical protein
MNQKERKNRRKMEVEKGRIFQSGEKLRHKSD